MTGPSRQNVVLALEAGTFDEYVAGMRSEDKKWCECYAMELEVMRDSLADGFDLTLDEAWARVKEAVL